MRVRREGRERRVDMGRVLIGESFVRRGLYKESDR